MFFCIRIFLVTFQTFSYFYSYMSIAPIVLVLNCSVTPITIQALKNSDKLVILLFNSVAMYFFNLFFHIFVFIFIVTEFKKK